MIKLNKGYDLNLKGGIADFSKINQAPEFNVVGIVPDDFYGVTPKLEKKEGDQVLAGEPIYHDKNNPAVKVVAPMSGTIKEVVRGERRKIELITIQCDNEQKYLTHETANANALDVLTASGLFALMRQRPYDVVPSPEVKPRDIFVTCFDSAPLAAPSSLYIKGNEKNLAKGVEVLKSLTDGDVYLGCKAGEAISGTSAKVYEFCGPHPAGNVGVQIENVKPVNKGEVVWTLDVQTLIKIGKLFNTGTVDFSTLVAVTGEKVAEPKMVATTFGAPITSLFSGTDDDTRVISGNVLTGVVVGATGYLRAPYRQVSAIANVGNKDEFMGWASVSPNKFSIYRTLTAWLLKHNKPASIDARIHGGERAIVLAGEYDRMLPMDIYAEFLIKAIITFDIDKMEQLGIYEVAPEDFALAEFADTSKLALQEIVRKGLDRLRAEMS